MTPQDEEGRQPRQPPFHIIHKRGSSRSTRMPFSSRHKLLFQACMMDDVSRLDWFGPESFDVNTKDLHGTSAIELAASWGSHRVFEKLFENPNCIIEKPRHLLHALNMGAGCKPNSRTMSSVCVEKVLKRFPNVVLNGRLSEYNLYTILGSAITSDYTESVKVLLDAKADPNPSESRSGIPSPLTMACANSNPLIVKLLLLHGATVGEYRKENVVKPKHAINVCLSNISLYAFGRPLQLPSFTYPGGLSKYVTENSNLECFILLVQNNGIYDMDERLENYDDSHEELLTHPHYKLFASVENQKRIGKLFRTMKARWWVRKVIRSEWYERAIQKCYKPGVGAGFFSTLSSFLNA